jgi:ABC-type uncharacterized transport system substrate-binding protein
MRTRATSSSRFPATTRSAVAVASPASPISISRARAFQMYRRAAYFVDRIFKGEKPPDLPVEQVTKFELVLNLKTSKAIAIEAPATVLVRAEELIE